MNSVRTGWAKVGRVSVGGWSAQKPGAVEGQESP